MACLLAFFQQQRLFKEQEAAFRPFNIEKPLWIFVGGSVTQDAGHAGCHQTSSRFCNFWSGMWQIGQRASNASSACLIKGLSPQPGRIFLPGASLIINTLGLSATQVFDETLSTLFNAPGGGSLYVENLKGATGEIALHVGDNEPFGVINVGDDAKLVKLCEDKGLQSVEREFSGSLFHEINKPDSTVNLLIGSKKFTEGWNSWRVSTMGLMNVGQTEGSQIIQLFGRGVRLKGFDLSLKRSSKEQLPDDIERPKHIGVLETLSIFGIRADYMAQFRDFLEEEGLPTNDDRLEFLLPVIKNLVRRS